LTKKDGNMEQTWVGRDARWLQWALVVVWVVCGFIFDWLGRRTLAAMGGTGVALFLEILLIVLFVGLTVGGAIYILRYRPITVTVDDKGVTIAQGGTSRDIAYEDMAAVTELPQTVSSSTGIQIYPSKEFLLRTGSADNPERPSRRWAIPGLAFSDKQMAQLAPSLRKHCEAAGTHYYIAR